MSFHVESQMVGAGESRVTDATDVRLVSCVFAIVAT